MKIHSVKISNILSFAYHANIDDASEVRFEDEINILIGPNGSGKSSFLEVLNQITQRSLFVGCAFDSSLVTHATNKKKVLQKEDIGNLQHITRHWDTPGKAMHVRLSISFNQEDLRNMNFVLTNREQFNSLFSDYCNEAIQVPECSSITNGISKDLMIDFTSNDVGKFSSNVLNNSGSDTSPIQVQQVQFIQFYLQRFEFLQRAIELNNVLVDGREKGTRLEPLARTFGIIGCYRNYNTVIDIHDIEKKGASVHQREQEKNLRDENTRTTYAEEPRPFALTKSKLSYAYNAIMHKSGQDGISAMANDPIFSGVNLWLKEYLQMQLEIKRPNPDHLQQKFSFSRIIDNKSRNLDIKDLSSGEKGLFYFIMTFVAYDLRHGLMIIDEPELHLHPQAQKNILRLLSYLAKEWDIQFIIATHSPIFVTSETINDVKRFDIRNGATQIFQQTVGEADKHLVRILTYTNSSKVFFSKRVVLVEGECDEYFYRFFFDDYASQKKKEQSEQGRVFDVEFLSITGKGARNEWTDFLKGFGVKVFFIGDWDNVVDLKIISQADLDDKKTSLHEKISDEIDKGLKEKKSEDGKRLLEKIDAFLKDPSDVNKSAMAELRDYLYRRYTPWASIIAYWKEVDLSSFDSVIAKIQKKYANDLFVLKEGVLEDYLNVDGRCDLNAIIIFCKNNFDGWKSDEKNKTKLVELNAIFDRITDRKSQ